MGAGSGGLGALAGAGVRLGALALAVSLGYEIVRAGAKAGTGRLARTLRAPGLVLQHLTTRELDRVIGVLYELTERWFQPVVRLAYPRP